MTEFPVFARLLRRLLDVAAVPGALDEISDGELTWLLEAVGEAVTRARNGDTGLTAFVLLDFLRDRLSERIGGVRVADVFRLPASASVN